MKALDPEIVFLANIFAKLLFGGPWNIPGDGPGTGVGARIVDRRFIVHRVLVRPRDLFDDVELIGMRMTPLVKPCRLVVSNAVYDKGIALPMSDRMPKVAFAIDGVARRMWPSIHINLPPDVSSA